MLLARVAVVLPTAQAMSCVGNYAIVSIKGNWNREKRCALEKSAVAHDVPLDVALATAEETTDETAEETADMLTTMYVL